MNERSNRSGGGRFNNNNRSGGGRNFRRRPSRNRRRNKFKAPKLDISKFINRVTEITEIKPYEATHRFADFQINENLKKNILSKGYQIPTPIQDQAIPHILEGKDLIGLANTGTGKTAAFLLPLINKVLNNRGNRVLIIAPTRELALQIEEEFRSFARGLHIYSASCIGGASINRQYFELRRNPNFVIGTPGRLKDLYGRNALDLSRFNNIVLDEVDRMLDMGFIDDIKEIISYLPEEKQSLFFSATLPKQTDVLIQQLLKNPVTVSVRTGDTSKNVDQDIVQVRNKEEKIEQLHELLSNEDFKKVLIFGSTKHGVEKLTENLNRRGFKAVSIHGDKSQGKRQRALKDFKTNYANIMVATDVAARGLDIDNVSHVINYEVPQTYEDYIHRIGRTGRANKKGFALTFVD